MSGRDIFHKIRALVRFSVVLVGLIPIRIVEVLWGLIRRCDSRVFDFLRYVFLHRISNGVGSNVLVSGNVYLLNPRNVVFGSNVSIHPMCYIDGYGGISIGDNVSIAHSSSLLSFEHQWSDVECPIKYNDVKAAPIVIESDVWIGAGVRILAGAHIHSRVVVAAGAVVKGCLESGWIYGGVPARKLKKI